MSDSFNEFSGKKDLKGLHLTGDHSGEDFSNSDIWKTTFDNFIGKNSKFIDSDFQRSIFKKPNFKNANFSGAENLHTVTGLSTAIFNDDTIIDDVDLELIAKCEPIVAQKLRTIRYVGRIKRKQPWIYWPWKIICDCGRSWIQLVASAISVSILFSVFYLYGVKSPNSIWLPHIFISCETVNTLPSFYQCFQFSALTLASFNMPNIVWYTTKTGIWVILEVWSGIILLGALVSVIATNIAKNE